MTTIDEEIARRIQEALDSGELSQAKGYGKPLPDDPGWDATPAALRMPMKILKDAGAAPPEVALFHERAHLRTLIAAGADPNEPVPDWLKYLKPCFLEALNAGYR